MLVKSSSLLIHTLLLNLHWDEAALSLNACLIVRRRLGVVFPVLIVFQICLPQGRVSESQLPIHMNVLEKVCSN